MPDGPLGDIWDECTQYGRQRRFDKARDRHLPAEKLIKDFTYSFGMTPCPSCGRRAWKILEETAGKGATIYKEECEICGQPAIHIDFIFTL